MQHAEFITSLIDLSKQLVDQQGDVASTLTQSAAI